MVKNNLKIISIAALPPSDFSAFEKIALNPGHENRCVLSK